MRSAVGLLIVIVDFVFRSNPQSYKWAIIPYSLFVFIPYFLVVAGWIVRSISKRQQEWYDEKQKMDVYKSSAFTLLLSMPLMLALFAFNYQNINGIVSVLWLPFYLFMTLVLFSSATLYNYKSN